MPSGGFRGHGVRRLIVIRHNGLVSGFIFIKKCSKKKIMWRDQNSSVYTLCVLHALFIYSIIHKQRPQIFCLSHPTLFSRCPLSLHFTLLHPVSINLIYPPRSNFFPPPSSIFSVASVFLSPKTPPLAAPSRGSGCIDSPHLSGPPYPKKKKKKKIYRSPPAPRGISLKMYLFIFWKSTSAYLTAGSTFWDTAAESFTPSSESGCLLLAIPAQSWNF